MGLTFQEIIQKLNAFWEKQGCILHLGYDLETGAGTFNPVTFFNCLGNKPYKAAFVEPSRRPTDGRYGEHPNRLQLFHQYQVILRPAPENVQELYLQSLDALGLEVKKQDVQFVHDDWESPTLGAVGLGWEVRMNGMEISQFTYFQSMASIPVRPVVVEITYGLERLAMYVQKKPSIYDIAWNKEYTVNQLIKRSEQEWSKYNFDAASTTLLQRHFLDFEKEVTRLLQAQLPLPAYDFAIKASHTFNVLDARGILSAVERKRYIACIRDLNREIANTYLKSLDKKYVEPPTKVEQPAPTLPTVDFSKESKKDLFVFEVGSEEMPPSELLTRDKYNNLEEPINNWLQKQVHQVCEAHALEYKTIHVFCTIRRITIIIEDLHEYGTILYPPRKGPQVSQAFDASEKPSMVGKKFMQMFGTELPSLPEVRHSSNQSLFHIQRLNNVEYLYVKQAPKRVSIYQVFAEHFPKIFAQLPFSKKMVWDSSYFSYPRPIRWIFSMYGETLFPCQIANIIATNQTKGHPQKSEGRIDFSCAQDYLTAFNLQPPSSFSSSKKNPHVTLPPAIKKHFIAQQLSKCLGLEGLINTDFFAPEIIPYFYSLENPEIHLLEIEPQFVKALPPNLIELVLCKHQLWCYLSGSHISSLNSAGVSPGASNAAMIISENGFSSAILDDCKTVVSARLKDAMFLIQQDKHKGLDFFNDQLEHITLHERLGSLKDKRDRIQSIIKPLYAWVPKNISNKIKLQDLEEAAKYCQADLASGIVTEYPELHGEMSSIYYKEIAKGRQIQDDTAVSQGLQWFTNPNPPFPISALLGLADRMDSINSYFWAKLQPSSSADPFALRRQAFGVLSILWHLKLSVPLEQLIEKTFPQALPYPDLQDKQITKKKVLDFIEQRLNKFLSDLDYPPVNTAELRSLLEAQKRITQDQLDVYDISQRWKAWHHFKTKRGGHMQKLLSTYKRIVGFVPKNVQAHPTSWWQCIIPPFCKRIFGCSSKSVHYDPSLASSDCEKALQRQVNSLEEAWSQFVSQYKTKKGPPVLDYSHLFDLLPNLCDSLEEFLNTTKIEEGDTKIRNNRIALLSECFELIGNLVDLSQIELKKNHHK